MQRLITDIASGGLPPPGKAALIVPNAPASVGHSCGHEYWFLLPCVISAAMTEDVLLGLFLEPKSCQHDLLSALVPLDCAAP